MKYKWYQLFFPKQPTATWSFMVIKLSLLALFFGAFIFESGWSIYCMKIYRDKVADVKASSLFPSRSEIQVYSTHSHFFLFTGLMAAGAVLVGFWGILMEYLVIIVGYCYIHTVSTLFEVIGAYFSEDDQVAVYKVYGVFPEPFLILFGLIFAHMVRVGEKEMASSPLYKQKMAARAGKGETMAYVQTTGIEVSNNNNSVAPTPRSRGVVNQGLDLSGEEVAKDVSKRPSPSSSGNSSRPDSDVEVNVTVVTDGSTKLQVASDSNSSNKGDNSSVTVSIEQ